MVLQFTVTVCTCRRKNGEFLTMRDWVEDSRWSRVADKNSVGCDFKPSFTAVDRGEGLSQILKLKPVKTRKFEDIV